MISSIAGSNIFSHEVHWNA